MHPGGGGGELRDERACHGNVGLRAIDRIGPVNRHRAAAISRFAAFPILRPHMHAERRPRLFRIGEDVNLMPARRKAMRAPVGPHADPALDGRELADDTDSHRLTSAGPGVTASGGVAGAEFESRQMRPPAAFQPLSIDGTYLLFRVE